MSSSTSKYLDAVIVGAGFSGMYLLKKLRDEQGLSVRVFDKAGGVGGTWYWNRYPGALSDTESFVYCYSWDKELLQEWDITTRYLTQPQILDYLEHVADRYKLRPDIQLNTGMKAARFNESTNLWEVEMDNGEEYTAKFLVTALGILSATVIPEFRGLDTFEGTWYHTGDWPKDLDLSGKRVGIIGTASTGTQIITAIAPEVAHLTVFQRSPQYSVPVGNGPVSDEYTADIKKNYDKIWDGVWNSTIAFGFEESTVPTMSVSAEERKAIFQKSWDKGGGFRFMFETFSDIASSEEANFEAQEFIRGKIAEIVKDPETARKLSPQTLWAQRPLCDSGYYATYNRDNVELVDVKADPIAEITPKGVKTSSGAEYEVDVLIFATGFDSVDGNLKKINIYGRDGLLMNDHWKDGATSYMGTTIANFPNLLTSTGPNGPFANFPPVIDTQVEWICDMIKHVNDKGLTTVEPKAAAEESWTKTCLDLSELSVFTKGDSWIFGTNVPGKPKTVYFYMGGLNAYRDQLAEGRDGGYQQYEFS